MNGLICSVCGRDIDAIGQENVSCVSGYPLCEDCGSEGTWGNSGCEFDKEEDVLF